MPMQRDRYPADWERISLAVREAAGWRCAFCGVEQGAERIGTKGTPYKVVLTVAHLDHDDTDSPDARLAALCQPCHLRYDVEHHKHSAAATRRRRQVEAGQQALWEEET